MNERPEKFPVSPRAAKVREVPIWHLSPRHHSRSVAKAWNEATTEDAEVQVPEMPADVQGRLEAIWADAYRAAWDTIAPERDRLQGEVEQLAKLTESKPEYF